MSPARGVEPDAAVAFAGFEVRAEHVVAECFAHAGQQIVVHRADELALVLDQRVERAVGEDDLVTLWPRLVAELLELVEAGVEQRASP